MRPDRNSIDWLDYARFAAAFAVMAFHYTANGIRRGVIENYDRFGIVSDISEYGYLGVDLFFLISGYVIALTSSSKDAASFAISRFVRLWPTFLLCLFLTAIVRVTFGGDQFAITIPQLIANTTMLAPYLGFDHIDSVYWTLAYELGFYGLVFAIILVGQKRHLEWLMIAWLPIIAAFDFIGISFPLIGNYNYLFVIGFLIQSIEGRGWNAIRALGLFFASVMAVFAAIERAAQMSLIRGDFELSGIIVGFATSCFIALFFVFSREKLRNLKLPFARRLGLMTYPLYLLHAYIGYVVLNIAATETNKLIIVPAVMICVLAASYLVTKYFEEPLLTRIKGSLTSGASGIARRLA